ncbi:alpha/beta fold hydrolase [Afifella sp. H1R]|uniref:alpha/beta fold hydrolase n=1 Tax=Afifella sp. H1R TaxID=2908841 RepID=UPI001F23ACA3|nr:alpha/beta fold hydrolase [Afifella sp. H1R]MCF1502483.1 alpha/beta fold hydrolase [Afifella sp. H1R]
MSSLFVRRVGQNDGIPVVLLHGFAGSHRTWDDVCAELGRERSILLYDLPGHAASLAYPELGHAVTAARAVRADLAERAPDGFHLAGHSMGGAAAALIALKEPEKTRSLTLLAPGGFGPAVNHRALTHYAAARGSEEMRRVLEEFVGFRAELSEDLILRLSAEREVPGAGEALVAISETLHAGGAQKMLPLEAIAALPCPLKLLWGEQDRILPASQARGLPGVIGVHLFADSGHMLPWEIPSAAARLISENSR